MVEDYHFEILATLRFNGSFSTSDIEGMTWFECERLCAFYHESEERKMKRFAFHNLESSRMAYYGKQSDLERYLRDLRNADESKENDLEAQFEGIDFGK